MSAAIPLGFTFAFDGSTYTQVVASSNGFLSFNTAATSANANSLTTAAAAVRPLVAPLWDNLAGTANNSRAAYQVGGTAPNRTFTFEWSNWKWNQAAAAAVVFVSGEAVRRHQRGGVHLPAHRRDAHRAHGQHRAGGAGTGSGSFLSLSDAVAAPTASSTLENASIGTAPPGPDLPVYARRLRLHRPQQRGGHQRDPDLR